MTMENKIKTTSLDWYHNDFVIPAFGWRENVYIDYDGAVRAMRFKKIEFTISVALDGYSYLRTPKPVYHVDIAGVGTKAISGNSIGKFPMDYLLNSEFNQRTIYKESKEIRENDVRYKPIEWMSECFGVSRNDLASMYQISVHDGNAMMLVRYIWDGVKPTPVPLTIPDKVYYTQERGWHFNEPCILQSNSYATYDRCYKENKVRVVEFDEEPTTHEKYNDIMDTYNAHRAELVRRINSAWKDDECHDRFASILFALGCRDKEEILDKLNVSINSYDDAMRNAHEILENVCDDWDLETILSFVRYEENL